MIKRLRRKFIIINMSLVSLVLLIVFTSISYVNYDKLRNESNQVLQRAVDSKEGTTLPSLEIGGRPGHKSPPMMPIFSVLIDDNSNIVSIFKENVIVSDEVVGQLTRQVMASGQNNGILWDLQLRFLQKQTPGGIQIAFVDISREIDLMTNLLVQLLLIGLGGLLAFFLISVFLAGWALRPVEKAWEQQRQFVADASHELKTPLTVILTNIGILHSQSKETIEKQIKWVDYIQAEANRMKKLVDDLLFLAKADSAGSLLLPAELNLSDAVWSCLLPFEPIAYEQGIEIKSTIAPAIKMYGDEGQLKQLVVILLDNACKYAGEKGTVEVTLENTKESIIFAVNNSGAPIPQEQLEHIFKRFYRVDSSRAREQGGYGLGLAIAKTIVENHRGKISVESNAERGTTFLVKFPVK